MGFPSQYLLVQSQQWKPQNKWNLFKINNKDTTVEQRHWRRFSDFIVNSEQISHIALVFPWLTLDKQMLVGLLLI